MTLRFHLIRHASYPLAGVALGGRAEHPLDERGRHQAEGLAGRLAGAELAAVYTSPQRRAQETAAPIAARHGLVPVVDAALAEMDFGQWTGCRFDDLAADPAWQRFNAARSLTRIPGGETMLEVQARLAGFALRLRGRHPDGVVAAVSHADPLRALLCWLLGMPLDQFARLEIEPAGMAVVALDDWGARLLELHRGP
jgi:broad specificity phosphatase PhoE